MGTVDSVDYSSFCICLSEGHLESPYIYPSAYFNRPRVEYVEQMRAVSEDGAWDR